MAKLFLFGIGGTGSRVIKSLTMLLGSGMKINASQIVPIILDPHLSNKDLQRTEELMRNYQKIYDALGDNRNDFFNTKITTLQNLRGNDDKGKRLSADFAFQLGGVENKKFGQYIGFDTLDPSNKALASLLFSKKNLETDMQIGFIGNPNIGSVVLNQFTESDEFKHFASNFDQNDRVFIISSIFGGTGAAGFPLLVKNLRNAQPPLSNHQWLRESKIGAVTLMPYFGVEPSADATIDKATFITKTKAALSYYNRNLTGNRSLNALYYLGDPNNCDYANDPGAGGQQNNAHFIELAAALSIVDFMNTPDDALENEVTPDNRVKAKTPHYREFGLGTEQDLDQLHFEHLADATNKKLAAPLAQMWFMRQHLKEKIRKDDAQPYRNRKGQQALENAFFDASFYRKLDYHLNGFTEWLTEMSNNKRGFQPFELKATTLGDSVKGIRAKKGGLFSKLSPSSYDTDLTGMTECLNHVSHNKTYPTAEQKFVNIYHAATEKMLKEKFDFF